MRHQNRGLRKVCAWTRLAATDVDLKRRRQLWPGTSHDEES
jgi:hypothetical protein